MHGVQCKVIQSACKTMFCLHCKLKEQLARVQKVAVLADDVGLQRWGPIHPTTNVDSIIHIQATASKYRTKVANSVFQTEDHLVVLWMY